MFRHGSRPSHLDSLVPLYDFGRWGYHTTETSGTLLQGFQPEPPGQEISGRYDVVFVAALRFNEATQMPTCSFAEPWEELSP